MPLGDADGRPTDGAAAREVEVVDKWHDQAGGEDGGGVKEQRAEIGGKARALGHYVSAAQTRAWMYQILEWAPKSP